mgnify:CR=1 FL=1
MYFTEVAPLWNDDELTSYINPEAVVFGNPIAQALCSADCAAAMEVLNQYRADSTQTKIFPGEVQACQKSPKNCYKSPG